jgi:hypothetical protein
VRIQGSFSVPAATTTANLLQGVVGSIIRDPSAIDLFAVTDATSGVITASFLVDQESLLINGGINAAPGTGQGPRDPEDVILRNEAGPPGSILNLTFTNSDSAAHIVRYAVNITALT